MPTIWIISARKLLKFYVWIVLLLSIGGLVGILIYNNHQFHAIESSTKFAIFWILNQHLPWIPSIWFLEVNRTFSNISILEFKQHWFQIWIKIFDIRIIKIIVMISGLMYRITMTRNEYDSYKWPLNAILIYKLLGTNFKRRDSNQEKSLKSGQI